MNDELTIKIEKDSNTLIIQAKGIIDTDTAPKFEDAAKANLEGAENVILDFTELEYITSAGIRVIKMIYSETKRDKGNLIVRNPNTSVSNTLTIVGIAELITIENEK
jgi:anti-anti-sigma factor